ncbi:ABC transporter ATP-binding protein [Leucobacter sp. UT-8R-CII-1-4]|uniref:ABC transporter ATP-binding protein n=1 Tax=Leucobacter sp. UT-8R-CII-1-4 TaxID=3040075 RepID=UPI0024A9F7AB|nr:ABC transporter ATP-binding protein [Leucobacter sp. UT-8R-CII-1-4]MDI6023409.1 ABC transporter ATP-binding protein [Leucobacter sp. UT-8R-CII-1-4]
MTNAIAVKNAAISIQDLVLELPTPNGDVRVLDGVSFDIAPGEIVGIVGESGSGKSMTALTLMRLLPPGANIVSGQLDFHGVDLSALSPRELRKIRGRRIGMIFQDPMTTLDPVVQVGAQIDEAYRIHHPKASRAEARLRTIEMLELVGVPDAARRAKQYPHQWSGGMRQRAVIAMALVNDPEVVIADEPTTALDATIQAQVLDVLVKVRDELGVAIALITHDLGLIAQFASRAVVMYAGRVLEVAGTHELFDDSRHPYTAALISSRPGSTPRGEDLVTIPGRPPAMDELPIGCPFAPRCVSPFKSEKCDKERPSLEASADGRLSACHYRNERHEVMR